jgi:ribose 5-phosphate isomerase A
MKTAASSPNTDPDALKRAAAEAAVQLVEKDMVVGLGSGSTAAFAVEALARRHRQGLRFVGIPSSERTAARRRVSRSPHSASIARSISQSTARTRWNAARSI